MYKDIDIMNPDFTINCGGLDDATDIYQIMRDQQAKKYGYVIARKIKAFEYEILKIGESAPAEEFEKDSNRKVVIGERVERQIAKLNGWSQPQQRSSHGQDLQNAVNDAIIQGKLQADFDKNDVIIGVWNLSDRESTMVVTGKEESRWLEGELTRQYKATHNGKLPMLNIVDPENNKAFRSPHVSKENYHKHFSFS